MVIRNSGTRTILKKKKKKKDSVWIIVPTGIINPKFIPKNRGRWRKPVARQVRAM